MLNQMNQLQPQDMISGPGSRWQAGHDAAVVELGDPDLVTAMEPMLLFYFTYMEIDGSFCW